MELPGKPKVVKKSPGNSPMRKEQVNLNPPEKLSKKPAGKSPSNQAKIEPK